MLSRYFEVYIVYAGLPAVAFCCPLVWTMKCDIDHPAAVVC